MRRFVPQVDNLEGRIALDGDSGVATGPLPVVAGNPIGGVLENPGDETSMVPRDAPANIDPDLILSYPVDNPTVFPDYPSKTMLFGLAPQDAFAPEEYPPEDYAVPYFPNGTDAFADPQDPPDL